MRLGASVQRPPLPPRPLAFAPFSRSLGRDRGALHKWLEYLDQLGQSQRHLRSDLVRQRPQFAVLVEVAPRGGPSFQLDVGPQNVLDLEDMAIEVGQVRIRADRTILEMEPDAEDVLLGVAPDLVMHTRVAVIDLEQQRVRPVPKVAVRLGNVHPQPGHHLGEEVMTSHGPPLRYAPHRLEDVPGGDLFCGLHLAHTPIEPSPAGRPDLPHGPHA